MLFKNARTRLPFEGVSAFYQALHTGYSSKQFRPIFYVSSSSWKLYDLLSEFFMLQNIPKGPLLLRDSRLDRFKFKTSLHKGHKLIQVDSIMHAFPQKKFILIGDSGQKDPEIYQDICEMYPNRVLAIYIRDIGKEERHSDINEIADKLAAKNIPMLLVPDTTTAARHAFQEGWISQDSLNMVKGEKKNDRQRKDRLQTA
jgi:phosphatidate phosphatase APP1